MKVAGSREKKMSSIYFVYNIAMCDITFQNKNPAVQCTICSKVLVFFSKFQIHLTIMK